MEEKRFDVRVPLCNTTLLEQLAMESAETGMSPSRLLVQYATRYVKMTKGGLIPSAPLAVSSSGEPSSNGHQLNGLEARLQPLLNSNMLDAFSDEDG